MKRSNRFCSVIVACGLASVFAYALKMAREAGIDPQ